MTITGAVILAAIAGALHYKQRVPRLVAWLAFIAGTGAAATIAGWLGGLSGLTIFGVGAFTVAAIITGIFFWEEAVKRNGIHRVRTPLIAVAFGVSLMSAGGALFGVMQNAVHQSTTKVDQTVQANLNGSK